MITPEASVKPCFMEPGFGKCHCRGRVGPGIVEVLEKAECGHLNGRISGERCLSLQKHGIRTEAPTARAYGCLMA